VGLAGELVWGPQIDADGTDDAQSVELSELLRCEEYKWWVLRTWY
jgi:hypothetical protein